MKAKLNREVVDPVCFVLMPFGKKRDPDGALVDFDAIYGQVIAPAIRASSLIPLRADEELSSGMIHKEMFERLILCDLAVVDISVLNANVYYELGIRHALRKKATVIVGSGDLEPPFDLAPMRVSRYSLQRGRPDRIKEDSSRLAEVLLSAQNEWVTDSPLFQLLDMPTPDISRLKTDTFRDRSRYDAAIREQLAEARPLGAEAVIEAARRAGEPESLSAGVATDILLSLRATESWTEMIDFAAQVSPALSSSSLFVEQRALALGRLGRYEEACRLIEGLIGEQGPTSERYGILGGARKRQWLDSGDGVLGRGYLREAIDAYRQGFLADWRDAYPGVNFLTLSFQAGKVDQYYREILPVVRFSIEQRLARSPDFWDYAAILEIMAVESEDIDPPVAQAVIAMRESWEGTSASEGMRRIEKAREEQGLEPLPWIPDYIEALESRAEELAS